MQTKKVKIDKKKQPAGTVPRGTVVTADLLVRQDNMYIREFLSKIFAFLILTVFPLFILNCTNAINPYGHYELFFKGRYWYYDITHIKTVTFRVLTILFTALSAALSGLLYDRGECLARKRRGEGSGIQKLTMPQILLLAYLGWTIVCAVRVLITKDYSFYVLWNGHSKEDALAGLRTEGLYHLFLYGAVFFFLSFWGEYSQKQYDGMSVMAIVFSIPAMLQLLGADILYPEGRNYANTMFLSTIGNVDCVGGVAAIVVPTLLCAFVVTAASDKKRYLYLAGSLCMSGITFWSDVDSYKLGLAGALVITLPFLLDTKAHIRDTMWGLSALVFVSPYNPIFFAANGSAARNAICLIAMLVSAVIALLLTVLRPEIPVAQKKMRKIVAIAECVLILAALLFLFFHDSSNTLLHEAHEVLRFRLSDEAGSGRGYTWKCTFKMIGESPIFGKGPGTFYYEFNPRFTQAVLFDLAHNDFLQIATHCGLIGMALYVAFLVALAARAFKAVRRSPLIIPFLGAAAGYLVHSFFSFSIAFVTPLFWVMAGLLDKCIRQLPTEVDMPEIAK